MNALLLALLVTANPPFSEGDRAFREAKEILARDQVDATIDEAELYRSAVDGMVKAGGRHKWDALLSPAELAEMKAGLAGEVVGIGVEIRFDAESGVASVVDVIPGSPAEKGDIKVGDGLIQIDGKSFKGQAMLDVVLAIRGKAGAPVALTVLRGTQVVERKLTRAAIPVPSVSGELLPGNIGLVTMTSFNEKTPAELEKVLEKLAAQNARGLVFDVRDDAGGLFDKMVECAGLVLPPGATVVTGIDRAGVKTAHVARGKTYLLKVPVAVAVNEGTGSGAEIFAGALRIHRGAKIVGRKTLGKWNVQRINTLSNGYALKVTVGIFETPNGERLDGVGLSPDLEVEQDAKTLAKLRRLGDPKKRLEADAQLRTAIGSLGL